jgi:hypothetical protein
MGDSAELWVYGLIVLITSCIDPNDSDGTEPITDGCGGGR